MPAPKVIGTTTITYRDQSKITIERLNNGSFRLTTADGIITLHGAMADDVIWILRTNRGEVS